MKAPSPYIPPAAAATLRCCGWDCAARGALSAMLQAKNERGHWAALVYPSGRWSVVRVPARQAPIAQGREADAASAAMMASEVLWAMRDGRDVPAHVAPFMAARA